MNCLLWVSSGAINFLSLLNGNGLCFASQFFICWKSLAILLVNSCTVASDKWLASLCLSYNRNHHHPHHIPLPRSNSSSALCNFPFDEVLLYPLPSADTSHAFLSLISASIILSTFAATGARRVAIFSYPYPSTEFLHSQYHKNTDEILQQRYQYLIVIIATTKQGLCTELNSILGDVNQLTTVALCMPTEDQLLDFNFFVRREGGYKHRSF